MIPGLTPRWDGIVWGWQITGNSGELEGEQRGIGRAKWVSCAAFGGSGWRRGAMSESPRTSIIASRLRWSLAKVVRRMDAYNEEAARRRLEEGGGVDHDRPFALRNPFWDGRPRARTRMAAKWRRGGSELDV